MFAFLQQADRSLMQVNAQLAEEGGSVVQTPLQFAYQSSPKSLVRFNKGKTANHASMIVGLSMPDQRKVANQTLIDHWYAAMPKLPFVKNVSISEPRAGPPVPAIKILLKGYDSEQLKRASEALQSRLALYAGVHGIKDNMPYGPTEVRIRLRERAKAMGLDRQALERELFAQVNQVEIHSVTYHGETLRLALGLDDSNLRASEVLSQLPVVWRGQTYRLDALVDMDFTKSFSRYYSFNSQSGVLVTAETSDQGNTVGSIVDDLQTHVVADIESQYPVQVSFETQARSQTKALAGIRSGAVIALVLIYGVLAWVLSSYFWPLLVMAVIPVGLSGALWGHYLLGMHLSILSIFGLFGLTGIVVNDSIILLHRFQHNLQTQTVSSAMVHACCERFRAVMLTSLTTIIGMGPLLLNKSLQAQFIIPMAISICGGLFLATLMLILFLPAIAASIQPLCALWLRPKPSV